MKKIISILFLALFMVTTGRSQSTQPVERVVESFRKALIEADNAVLDKLLDKDLTYGHSSGKVEDKASLIASLVNGSSDFVTIDLTDQTVMVKGRIGIVRHLLSATTNDNGHPSTVKLKILLVWHKVHGQWQLLARQAVKA